MSYENYDPCFPDQPVVDLYLPVWASHLSFRSKPAFIWVEDGSDGERKGSTLTYSQLNSSAEAFASHLLVPLKRRDTVLILCSPGLQLVRILFGCQRAGLLSVPIFPPDPSFTKENYHHLVRVLLQTKPKAAIAHPDYITSVRRYVSSSSSNKLLCQLLKKLTWISADGIEDTVADRRLESSSYLGCKPEEAYLIQYTSGATGIPKPVIVTVGSAAHNVRMARKAYDLQPNSVIVSWLPQYHDCGLMFLLLTVVAGATCVMTSPAAFVNRPRLWLEMITEFKATCTPVPSFTLPLVVRRGGIDRGTLPLNLWSLRNLIIINEPIYRASVEEFVREFSLVGLSPSSISPSYGLAENCTFVSTAWRGSSSEMGSFPKILSYNKLLPCARLASNSSEDEEEEINILVVNEKTCEPVDDGTEGEIWVSSPSNASGYLGHPSLTLEVFQRRLGGMVSRSFVRTGDRGVIRGEERYLFVTGRCSDFVQTRSGVEIHPHYIETAAYNSCPKLLRGGCLAAFGISNTVVVVAELQRSEGEVHVLRRVCESIKEAILKEESIEVGVVVLVKSGSVPKTTSGKIQRWAAKEKFMRGKLNVVIGIRFGEHHLQRHSSMSIVDAKMNKGEEEKDRRRGVGLGEREEMLLSFSGFPNRLSLLSFL